MGAVYKAINAVQADLAKEGIAKSRKNQQQGYSFRGIDDVFNALAPLLARHGLCILPRILARQCEERTNQKGTALFYVVVEAEFDFIAAEDGSKHVVRTYGEAMDSADKATNKAMSAAYKYAAMQAFAIPTEGDNDADATTHAVQPRQPVAPQPAASMDEAEGLLLALAAAKPEDRKAAYIAAREAMADLPGGPEAVTAAFRAYSEKDLLVSAEQAAARLQVRVEEVGAGPVSPAVVFGGVTLYRQSHIEAALAAADVPQ